MESVSGGAASVQVRVVPMVPGMRTRKRQCSSNNNSTAAENDNDSILSSCDGCSFTDNDSMRPVADFSRRHSRSSKRRRTILDAFNSISLKGASGSGGVAKEVSAHINSVSDAMPFFGEKSGSDQSTKSFSAQIQNARRLGAGSNSEIPQPPTTQQYTDDADSSRAVAEDSDDYGGYTTNSSLEEEDEFEDDDEEDVDEQMLSDKELLRKNAERKVMLELVFGPESTFCPPKDPVDRKLQTLIRSTIQQVATGRSVEATLSQDDMSLPGGGNQSTTSSLDSCSMAYSSGKKKRSFRRSVSSPELQSTFTVTSSLKNTDEEMDTSDIG